MALADGFNGNTLTHIVIFIVCFFASSIFFRAFLRKYKENGGNLDRITQIKRDISTKLSLANPTQLEGFAERLSRDIHTSVYSPRFDEDDDVDADGDKDIEEESIDEDKSEDDTSDDNSIDDSSDSESGTTSFFHKQTGGVFRESNQTPEESDCSTSDSDDDAETRDKKKEECIKERKRLKRPIEKAKRQKNKVGMAVENFVDKQRGTMNDAKKALHGALNNVQSKINHAVNQYAT